MTRKTKYSKEELVAALDGAKSIRDVISNLGLNINSGNYRAVKGYYLRRDLNLPEFDYSSAGDSLKSFNRIPDDKWFVYGTMRGGQSSRKRLVASGLKDECQICGLGATWNDRPIVLQVDHIDGDRFNNVVGNLRILCPNCHSQTETYSNNGRSKRNKYCQCGLKISRQSESCRSCASKKNKTGGSQLKFNFPPIPDLLKMLAASSYTSVAKVIGCSDNTIRKHLMRNGINPKTLDTIDTV